MHGFGLKKMIEHKKETIYSFLHLNFGRFCKLRLTFSEKKEFWSRFYNEPQQWIR